MHFVEGLFDVGNRGEREVDAVASGELENGFRAERAFDVEMEFGLWEVRNEVGQIGITHAGHIPSLGRRQFVPAGQAPLPIR